MVYVRAFKATDLKAFTPLEPMEADSMDDPEFAKAIEDSELAITGIRNGKIVGCGGVHPIENNKTDGEMWIRLSETCRKHPFDTLRWLRDGLEIVEKTFPFEKLYASMRCSFPRAIKLIKHLGFKKFKEVLYENEMWHIYSKEIKCRQHC